MNTLGQWLSYLLILFFLQTHSVFVQAAQPSNKTAEILSLVRGKIEEKKVNELNNGGLQPRVLEALTASEADLEQLLILEEEIRKVQGDLKKLPLENKELTEKIRNKEKNLNNNKEDFSIYPIEELEQRLIIEKSQLNELKAALSQLEFQISQQQRPQQIREKIAEIKSQLSSLQQEKSVLETQVRNDQELEARHAQVDARARVLNASETLLDLENIIHPLTKQSLSLQWQLLNLQRQELTELINGLEAFLLQRRQLEIDKTQGELLQAQKQAASKHQVIQEVTRENIHYNRLLQETNKKLEKYVDQNNRLEQRFKQLQKDFQSAEQKINLAGLSPALGNLLREQHRNLPLSKDYQGTFDDLQKEIALVNLQLLQLEDNKKSLTNLDKALLTRMLSEKIKTLDETEKLKIRTELRQLLNNQKALLVDLETVYTEYSRFLADIDFSLHQFVSLGEKYSHFLDRRLLWVPSAPMIDKHYIEDIIESIQWFFQASNWQQLQVDIQASLQASPLISLAGFSVLFLLVWFRSTIKNHLLVLLEKSSKLYADRFEFTFYGLGYVLLLVIPFSLSVACLGWILQSNEQISTFSSSVADGLLAIAIPLLIIQFFYRIFLPDGFVQTLFDWQQRSIALLHKQIKLIRLVIIPSMFLIGMFTDEPYSPHSHTLGRMALIVVLLVQAFIMSRLAHPTQGLWQAYYLNHPNNWITRFRYIWYALLITIPLVVVGFAIAGYYQSALELLDKLVILLRLAFFTVLIYEVIKRGMVLTNRQLALQNARQKRKLKEQAEDKELSDTATIILEDEELLDIPKINEQSKKLLNALVTVILLVGSWLTLSDILPAFSVLDQVVLWQKMALIDGKETVQMITLVNVFVGIMYLALMLIFVKNFPGMIDMLFAGRYSMTAGSRYALIQLTRYSVITLTVIAIANKLGGSWSQVQWLVAAVSVGLGFGLQEIFANMVSGVILLFERPIRVGDTVTVGDVNGTVCRIQMRATTIIDWDQKELVVPNKTFITDKFINWSLTDTVTRVVIPVGISYDSDDELAVELINQIINEAPLVLKDPEPSVYFLSFGDSSLDFSVRVFVRELKDRWAVSDYIHKKIRRAFKHNNIEIPYPQRDLHIRSSDFISNE